MMTYYRIKWFWRGELRTLAENLTEKQAESVLLSGLETFPTKRFIKELQ